MHFLLIFVFTAFILITNGNKLAPYRTMNCSSILLLKPNVQTTLLDLDENSDVDLKTCVLKHIFYNHSLILIGGFNTYSNTVLHKRRTIENPNVIIMTKHVSRNILASPSVRRVLKSHRSLVYISITGDERFKCIDGDLNATDFLSLEMFMNKLWHRYEIMRVVVTFPFSCKEKVAIYSGKRRTDKILYDRTIKLIDITTNDIYRTIWRSGDLLTEGYPLKANIFYRFPTSITDCNNLHYYTKVNLNLSEGYCGVDALVMHDIVEHFKYKLLFPNNSNCYKYGYTTDTNITGSLGCVVRKELDISFNSRFMTMYSEDYIYFLHFVAISSLCAVVKRPDVIPLEFYAVTTYRPDLWLVIFSLIIAIGILTWAIMTIKSKMLAKKMDAFHFYIKDAFTSLIFGFSLKRKGKLYILRGTCLCSSILFGAIFQGHINHMFTTLIRFDTIKTLDALYNSEYTLYLNPSMTKILGQLYNPENDGQAYFLERSLVVSENYTLDILLQHPSTALIGRKQDFILEILAHYTDEHDKPLINVVDECFYTYYLSYITRSGFQFYEEMQRFMQRLGEAGLPIIYQKWTSDMLRVPHSMPAIRTEPRTFANIKLEHQRITFGILVLGYIVSIIIFIIELVHGKRRRLRIGAR